MGLFKTLKDFMMKANYDFDRPDITLYNFHPQFRIFYMLNGVFFRNSDSLVRFITPVTYMGVVLTGLGIELMIVYHGVTTGNYSFAAESFCYALILGTAPFVYISTLFKSELIIKLISLMNEDFIFIRTLDSKYKDTFLKGQLLLWQMCWTWVFFCTLAAVVYIANAFILLLYQTFFATIDEHTIRPLIFPLWLPYDDPYRTPNYEIFMFIEIWIIYILNQVFGAYVYMQFHILLHYYLMMDMIILDLDVVFEGLDESVVKLPKRDPLRMEVQSILNRRLKRIIDWHLAIFRSIEMVSSVYGPPLAYQVLISSLTISIIMYQVVDAIEHGSIHILFTILLFEACLQLWIPCYLGTLVRDKILATSYSYFNMLRQSTKN